MLRGGAKVTSKSSTAIPPMVQKIVATAVSVPIFLFRQFQSMSRHQKLTALVFLLAGVFLGRSTVNPFWKRYTAVVDIPSHLFGSKAPVLHGRAVTVSDGDTIRFLHTPTPFHPKGLRKGEKASKIGLPIRICTIDTPETAKFGKSGQVSLVSICAYGASYGCLVFAYLFTLFLYFSLLALKPKKH